MALSPIVSQSDGPRVTVNSLVKSPRVIPARIIDLLQNQFLADSLLRDGGDIPGGVAQFWESTPLFSDVGSSIREEFGEYRIVTTSMGIPSIAVSVNRGMSIMVSEEMRRRNQLDRVNIQMTQVRNTMRRDWDDAFMLGITGNSSVPTHVAGTAFDGSGTAHEWTDATNAIIRKDILNAKRIVSEAVSGNQARNYLGFNPDTMVMSIADSNTLLADPTFNNVYQGNISDENLLYVGKLPNQILGLDVMISRTWAPGTVLVCERGTIGFICDERPLQATPLNEDVDRETWRSNVSRISAMGIDQPLAACVITGVSS